MTVLAMSGLFGFAPQTAKGTAASSFYYHKAMDVNIGPVQRDQLLPLEVGGGVLPTGAVKGGVYVAGSATLIPRLEDNLGWLLHGFAGAYTAEADPGGSTAHHYFVMPGDKGTSGSPETTKWMTFQRYIPGDTADTGRKETLTDCKVAGLVISLPAFGNLTMRVDVVGRVPTGSAAQSAPSASMEDYTTIPIASVGSFEVPFNTDMKALGGTLTLQNVFTTPDQEMIVGSYYPDDFVVTSRMMTIDWVYKVENLNLYDSIFYNDSHEWTPVVYTSSFRVTASPPPESDGTNNFELGFEAQKVVWSVEPVRLAGGDIVTMRFHGTVVEPESGDNWVLWLKNEQTATDHYNWPS